MTTPSRRRRISRKGPEQERRSTNMGNTTCCRCLSLVGQDACIIDSKSRPWCLSCAKDGLATLVADDHCKDGLHCLAPVSCICICKACFGVKTL